MNVSTEVHERAVKIVKDTLAFAKTIWPNHAHKFSDLLVTWEVKGARVAGLAYIGRNKVGFNPDYIGQSDFWITTVKHEVAHHIQKWVYPNARQAHGPEFRRIMQVLGAPDRSRHSMTTERLESLREKKLENSFDYYCPHCNKELSVSPVVHRRIQSGSHRYHISCAKIHGQTKPILRVGEKVVTETPTEIKKTKEIVLTPTPKTVHGPVSLRELFPHLY